MSEGFVGWMMMALRRNGFSTRRVVKTMEVVETLALGGRRQVLLMRCGGHEFLVGLSEDGVSTIVPVREKGQ